MLSAGREGGGGGGRALLYLPGARRASAEYPLRGIGKPGSGTEPIHQEHVMCSRFRGSCPSDVKSAVHPEPGFPISLSGYSAALCAPGRYKRARPPPPPPSLLWCRFRGISPLWCRFRGNGLEGFLLTKFRLRLKNRFLACLRGGNGRWLWSVCWLRRPRLRILGLAAGGSAAQS